MITLRGDLASAPLKKAVNSVTGLAMPGQRGCSFGKDHGVLWMSPDEALLIVPMDQREAAVKDLEKGLKNAHALVADVSDARSVFRLTGPGARETLAKVTPVDLHPSALQPGIVYRTRLAQVAGAFWQRDDGSFEVICFRSVADYVATLLKTSARTPVGIFTT